MRGKKELSVICATIFETNQEEEKKQNKRKKKKKKKKQTVTIPFLLLLPHQLARLSTGLSPSASCCCILAFISASASRLTRM